MKEREEKKKRFSYINDIKKEREKKETFTINEIEREK